MQLDLATLTEAEHRAAMSHPGTGVYLDRNTPGYALVARLIVFVREEPYQVASKNIEQAKSSGAALKICLVNWERVAWKPLFSKNGVVKKCREESKKQLLLVKFSDT